MNHLRPRMLVTAFIVQAIILTPAPSRAVFDAKTYPILGETVESLTTTIAKGTREKDGKRLVMTAHLSFPVERTNLLVNKVEENSANTKISGEKDLATGEVKLFLTINRTINGPPRKVTILMFDGEASVEVPAAELSRFQNIVRGRWEKRCSKFTGCQQVLTPDYAQQTYTWRAELPLETLRSFASENPNSDKKLAFWVGDRLDKAAKIAKKTSEPNLLLFRNQAKAVLEALEIVPKI